MKKIFGLSMAILMVINLAACSASPKTEAAPKTEEAAAAQEETKESEAMAASEGITGEGVANAGKIIMATNAEFPPYEYHDANSIVGIDVEIMQEIAKKMGCELVIEDIAFDSVIPEVVSGKADLGMAGMTVTEDRKQSVDFSDTYTKASQVVIVNDASPITSPADLEGKKVGVQLGTTGDIYAEDIKDVTVERYNKGFEAVQAMSQGKIDAVIIDIEPAKVFVASTEGIKILDEAFTEEEYAIAIKKGNDKLLNNINLALAKLKEEGKLDEIIAKYIK